MSKVVVAGGSGLIGRELTARLKGLGYEVVVLSRSGKAPKEARGVMWDAETVGPWREELEGAAAVINLVGSSIAVKWTKESKLEILESRLHSTKAIGMAIALCESRPPVWVNMSAIGFYGDRGSEELSEASQPGARRDFLVDTCVAWEAALDEVQLEGVRKVILRSGTVLGKEGGAFPQLLNLTKWFLGGHVGPGTQYMSWIHIKDLCGLIIFAVENDVSGPINGTSPQSVTNRFFMGALRGILRRPWAPPVPAFALTIANWFGAPDPSLLLYSQRVVPSVALENGFSFEFDDLRDAMKNLA